jgi:HemY protein
MRAACLWLLASVWRVCGGVGPVCRQQPGHGHLFWPPYRIDLSLNMVLLALALAFTTLYAALRALAALLALPRQAQRWRLQQKERAMHGALLDALAQLMSGRFLRSRKAAHWPRWSRKQACAAAAPIVPQGEALRALSHLVAADASHALQDRSPATSTCRRP